MSLLNIFISRERAEVFVDTEAGMHVGVVGSSADPVKRLQLTKAIVHAPSNSVIACRGTIGFLAVTVNLSLFCDAPGFDQLRDAMPGLLAAAADRHDSHLRQCGYAPNNQWEEVEVAIAGWSNLSSSMTARVFTRAPGRARFESFDIGPDVPWITPWLDCWGELPMAPGGQAEAHRLAADQVRRTRTAAPHIAIGGKLVLFEASRRAVRIEHSLLEDEGMPA